jgi:hypothetical protein
MSAWAKTQELLPLHDGQSSHALLREELERPVEMLVR